MVLATLLLGGCGGTQPGAGEPDRVSLAGKSYLLDTATEAGEPRGLVAGTGVRLEFTDDGRLLADAGCNTMSGPVTLDDRTLTVDGLETTERGCDAPRHEQDEWLAGVLSAGPTWRIEGTRLTLTGGDTELVLTDEAAVTPARPLTGTEWTVDTLVDGETAASTPAGASATIVFADGRAEVTTGCNEGSADYEVVGDTIRFTALTLTRRGCAPELMTLETAVVDVVRDEVAYAVDGDVLTLDHPSGKGLRLRAG